MANTISNRDIEQIEKGISKLLTDNKSANSISDRDVAELKKMLKRNDGGIARKTRNF